MNFWQRLLHLWAVVRLVFESPTSGASNDIENATSIARNMVTRFGMSDKFGMMGLATVENQYLEGRASMTCGEQTAALVDQEVLRIVTECYDKATALLKENREVLDHISDYLYEHETITGKEFMKIFRQLKGIEDPEQKDERAEATEETDNKDLFVEE